VGHSHFPVIARGAGVEAALEDRSSRVCPIQIVAPGNAVQGVIRVNDVALGTVAGGIRATGQQRAAQTDDADRTGQAQG